MKIKYIFLDVDGTLCNEVGEISPLTISAIKEAQEKGHKLFLCTGRSRQGVFKDLLEIGFDGLVGSAGAYVEVKGNIIHHESMDTEDVKAAAKFFDRHKIKYLLEANDCSYAANESIDYIVKVLKKSRGDLEVNELLGKIEIMTDDSYAKGINKILFFDCSFEVNELKEMLDNKYNIIGSTIELLKDESGELSAFGVTKAEGIQLVLDYFKADREDSIAIGDGSNDIEMLDFAGIGIAMGNAADLIKEHADYVTKDVNHDGVYHALKQFNLI